MVVSDDSALSNTNTHVAGNDAGKQILEEEDKNSPCVFFYFMLNCIGGGAACVCLMMANVL